MGRPHRHGVLGLSLAGLTLVGAIGCSSPPTRFYLLMPPPPGETAAGARADSERGIALGVGPISLPGYLDRPQIVSRAQGAELLLEEFHQWSEPLAESFSRVLAESIAAQVPTDLVALFPWKRAVEVEVQVEVQVQRFDTDASGEAVLDALWSIHRGGDETPPVQRRSVIRSRATSTDVPASVQALSAAAHELGREIASRIRETR
jgi:uncharacterized lipoprotein YmbA